MTSSVQLLSPDSENSLFNPANIPREFQLFPEDRPNFSNHLALIQYPRLSSAHLKHRRYEGRIRHHEPDKPIYLITLPFELREEIYTHLALASSFDILRVCRSINTQVTPLLYKYGIYHIRAIHPPHQSSISIPSSDTLARIQNLYISMPDIGFAEGFPWKHDMFSQTKSLLHQFSGDVVHRKVCHLDLQEWDLTEQLVSLLRTFVGFERIKITIRLRSYDAEDDDEHTLSYNLGIKEQREDYVKEMDERLGPWLGPADCTSIDGSDSAEGWGPSEVLLSLDFRPRVLLS